MQEMSSVLVLAQQVRGGFSTRLLRLNDCMTVCILNSLKRPLAKNPRLTFKK